jgi:tripartite ATP-independent transporter DctP family solute receptor
MTKIRKVMFSMLMISLLVLSVFTCAPEMYADDKYVFKIAYTDAPEVKMGNEKREQPTMKAFKAFKESVEKATKGKMKVEIYTNGRLGDVRTCSEQVLAGMIQANSPSSNAMSTFYKDIQILSIPYFFKDWQEVYTLLDGKFGKKMFNDMAKKSGFRVLGAWPVGDILGFSNNKRLIKTADDVKGLKIRITDTPLWIEMIKALGASATPVAWMEVYSALETGTVDGLISNPLTMYTGSLQEVLKYHTLDKSCASLVLFITSERYFRSLPKNIQTALVKGGRNAQNVGRDNQDQLMGLAEKKLKENSAVYTPTSAERDTFVKRCLAPCIKWTKANINHPEWIDEALKIVNKR